MSAMLSRIAVVAFLATAPFAGMAVVDKTAHACQHCVEILRDYWNCEASSGDGYTKCTVPTNHSSCTELGICIG